jgi:hypothetical protein
MLPVTRTTPTTGRPEAPPDPVDQGRTAGQHRDADGSDKPPAAGEPPAAGTAQGTDHANGADRTGTHPYPEVPHQRPSGPARPAEQGKHPDQAALTRIPWEYQGTNSDSTRSAYLSSPTGKPHLGPLGSEGTQPAKGEPEALPHDVARYLSTGDRLVVHGEAEALEMLAWMR